MGDKMTTRVFVEGELTDIEIVLAGGSTLRFTVDDTELHVLINKLIKAMAADREERREIE